MNDFYGVKRKRKGRGDCKGQQEKRGRFAARMGSLGEVREGGRRRDRGKDGDGAKCAHSN